MRKRYYVYILTNQRCTVLYTGVTNNLKRRLGEHQQGDGNGFATRYKANRLVYYETFEDVHSAIGREKQIKSWPRLRKIELVDTVNPEWRNLAASFDALGRV